MPSYADKLLKEIHEPRIVGVPPSNASRDLMRLPDGELRHYGGYLAKDGVIPVPLSMRPRLATYTEKIRPVYMRSQDNGLSWQERPMLPGTPGAVFQSPYSGRWLAIVSSAVEECPWRFLPNSMTDPGTYACLGDHVDGPFRVRRVYDGTLSSLRGIIAMRSRRRLLIAGCAKGVAVVLYSDDDGEHWHTAHVPPPPSFPIRPPHKWLRSDPHQEPTLVELSDGRLWMLTRTADEYFNQSFSDDGGVTWTAPEPSRFPGSQVMPTLKRLEDGRIMLFWCNAAVLPEQDRESVPECAESIRRGMKGAFLTNRNAFHVAISEDDGETWRGFRELLLNPLRNDSDYRRSGGNDLSADKGLHQSQAVELPYGKVLVSVGQHEKCRFLVIFDVNWLYESRRSDDFGRGLVNWSHHQVVRGVAGQNYGYGGHCAHNRRPGPQLVPDPDEPMSEALQIARHPDPRLLYEPQGAIWNFPAASSGTLRCQLRLATGFQGARISLHDRWVSPEDPTVSLYAAYLLDIDPAGRINGHQALSTEKRHLLTLRWKSCQDPDLAAASWAVDDGAERALDLLNCRPNGISYAHFQSTAPGSDPFGFLLSGIEFRDADENMEEESQ